MVIPIYDGNPFVFKTPPYITWTLIAINFAVFIYMTISGVTNSPAHQASILPLTFRPDGVLDHHAFSDQWLPWEFTLITYTFIHGNWGHLLGNMTFLWVFGDDVENALGRVRYTAFYFLCGAFGAIAHWLANPTSHYPLLGASGAIAGIVAAYLMLHPCRKIWVLAFMRLPIYLAAEWALGFWILLQILNVALSDDKIVAWWTHIGSLAAGAVLLVVLRPAGVKLFDCDQDRIVKPPRSSEGDYEPSR
jgi:membrane associated rhomboid family serine protease